MACGLFSLRPLLPGAEHCPLSPGQGPWSQAPTWPGPWIQPPPSPACGPQPTKPVALTDTCRSLRATSALTGGAGIQVTGNCSHWNGFSCLQRPWLWPSILPLTDHTRAISTRVLGPRHSPHPILARPTISFPGDVGLCADWVGTTIKSGFCEEGGRERGAGEAAKTVCYPGTPYPPCPEVKARHLSVSPSHHSQLSPSNRQIRWRARV